MNLSSSTRREILKGAALAVTAPGLTLLEGSLHGEAPRWPTAPVGIGRCRAYEPEKRNV